MKTNFLKSLFAIACLLCSIGVYAHDFEVDGIYYNKLSSTEVEVSYRGYSYDTYGNEYTGSVVIPDSVTYQGVTFSVTSINGSAFKYCTGLTEVTIGNSVTSIGEHAFYNCTGLESVTIGNSVTWIGKWAFAYCTGLTINFNAENCTSMGSSEYTVFGVFSNLTAVNIGESVKTIPAYAFYDCTRLTEVTIPNSVTSIGANAFYNCSGLTAVTIGNSVTSIGESAFYWCTGLKEVTIPNSVTSIGSSAFAGCSGLTEVAIGNSVTSIGDYTFAYCSSLKDVTIPNSVTSIGGRAFSGCTSLAEIAIPSSVTSIGEGAFFGCRGLRTVTIGSGVNEIGENTFDLCDRIKTVNCYAEIPPTIYSNTFTAYVNDHATLHVVKGCKEDYSDANYWEYFLNITDDLTAGVEDIMVDTDNTPVEYYDLNGFRVKNPYRGIYIMKQGNTVKKVVL